MDPNDPIDRTEPLQEEKEAGLLGRLADQTKEKLGRAKEGIASGAGEVLGVTRSVADATRNAAGATREKAGRVVEFVREAEPDAQLKASVTDSTQSSLDRVGNVVTGAAPAIGRGAERAAETLGGALHAVARPLAVILGAIAGTLGGWWKKAAEARHELPSAEEEACRAHFTTILVGPDMTYDRARTGYALGYVASRNPEYSGRSFEEVEPDLRRGFGDQHAGDYDELREFTRYGYTRGARTEL